MVRKNTHFLVFIFKKLFSGGCIFFWDLFPQEGYVIFDKIVCSYDSNKYFHEKNETFGHDKPFKRSYFTCTQKDKQTRKLFNFKIYFISTTSKTKPLAYKISNWITILKSLKSYSFLSDDLYIRNEITKCTFFSPLDCTIYNVIHWNFSVIEHIFIIYVAL